MYDDITYDIPIIRKPKIHKEIKNPSQKGKRVHRRYQRSKQVSLSNEEINEALEFLSGTRCVR